MAVTLSSGAGSFEELYLKLRHKYSSGAGETVHGVDGILRVTNESDFTDEDVAVSARGVVQSAVASGTARAELILDSPSEAAQFQPGDNVQVFAWDTGGSISTDTVFAVKGEKLLLSTAPDADIDPGDIVVRFETGARDGYPDSSLDKSAGVPYVGMGDMAAFLNALQKEMSPAVSVDITLGVAADDTVSPYSTIATDLDSVASDDHIGDVLVFTEAGDPIDGCSARIFSHGTGDAVTFTVFDIRDSDGNFLGNKFPVTIGNDSAVTTSASTKAELRTGLLDKYITAMMGEDFPTSGAGKAKVAGGCAFGMQENSNAPDATNLFASAIFDFLHRYDPALATVTDMPNYKHELSSLGHVFLDRTTQGVQLRLAANAAASDTTLTVEMDNAVGDIPFPLSGTVRIWRNSGINQTTVGGGIFFSTDIAYTRTKKSNVLTLASGTVGDTDAAPVAASFAAGYEMGEIVELIPTGGGAKMQGRAADIDAKTMLALMEAARLVAVQHTVPAIVP